MSSCVVSVVFISSSSGLFERGEGLAPFHDRGRSGAVCPTLAAAGASLREKREPPRSADPSPGHKPGDRRPKEKDRPIDPTSGKNSPA